MSVERQRAQRAVSNLRGFVRRPGLTGWVKDRSAAWQYREAFQAIIRLEYAEGIEASARLGDSMAQLRREATDRGLLTPTEVLDAEREALASVLRHPGRRGA